MPINGNTEARAFYTDFFKLRPRAKTQRMVPCPFHTDGRASFSVNLDTGLWNCHAGCGSGTLADFKQRLNSHTTIVQPANGHDRQKWTFAQLGRQGRKPVAEYLYTDATGATVMRKLRFEPKNFVLQRAENGRWETGLLPVTVRPLYNLPRALKAKRLLWCEGEKDVDRVQKVLDDNDLKDWAATTTYEASGGWQSQYADAVKEKKLVVCLPDNDEAGRKYMAAMARGCFGAGVQSVGTLSLPGLADKGDVSDYLNVNSPEDLVALLTDRECVEWYQDPVGKLFLTAAELRRKEPDEVPWLIEGMLAKGTFTQLMGQPKMGKSTLVHHALKAMLAGDKFVGRPVTQLKDVVYLTEMPSTDVLHELAEVPGLDKYEAHIHILPLHSAFQFSWEEAVNGAVAYALRLHAPLLIIDTFYVWARVKDENSASEVLAALMPIYDAVGKGLCVLLESHERKTGGDIFTAARGSNSLTGEASIVISIRMPQGNRGPDHHMRALEMAGRHGISSCVIDLTASGYELVGNSSAVAAEQAEKRVFEMLPSDEVKALSRRQLEDAGINVKRSTLQRALDNLEQTKLIHSTKGVRNTKFYWRADGKKIPKY